MLDIQNLSVSTGGKTIIKNLNLNIKSGEIHTIMGPNGSGKSSLSLVLAGNSELEIESGDVLYQNKNLLELEVHERALNGIFLAFQYPPEIPGIKNNYFLNKILENNLRSKNSSKPKPSEFIKKLNYLCDDLGFDKKLLQRNLNENFSGGEKKKNEIIQMNLLNPKFIILDEIDSGLDIDALKNIGNNIQKNKSIDNSTLVITHYPRLLKYIDVDFVHIMYNGEIIKTGKKELAEEIEKNGYESYIRA